MKTAFHPLSIRFAIAAALIAGVVLLHGAAPRAQSVAMRRTAIRVQQALRSLPSYGVFDFLVAGVDGGVVSLGGFAYRANLKADATTAIRRLSGVDEIVDKVDVLPASQNDDRIRWATFYRIYTDEFLSRYVPGDVAGARYQARSSARFPGMQPFGSYPIHIIVKNGRTILLGVVANESDKTLAAVRAREVTGVFGVENDLLVERK